MTGVEKPARERDPEVPLRKAPQAEAENERSPRPSEKDHEIAQYAENTGHHNIRKIVVCRKGSKEYEENQEGNEQISPHEGELDEPAEKQESDAGSKEIGDDRSSSRNPGFEKEARTTSASPAQQRNGVASSAAMRLSSCFASGSAFAIVPSFGSRRRPVMPGH